MQKAPAGDNDGAAIADLAAVADLLPRLACALLAYRSAHGAGALEGLSARTATMRAALEKLHESIVQSTREAGRQRLASLVSRGAPAGDLRLNLGGGASGDGRWITLDLWGGDLPWDLRWPLPFAPATVRLVYSSHVIEHLERGEALALLAEVRRVLAPSGALRLVVPDIEKCIRAYAGGDEEFFAGRKEHWHRARGCRTPLEHFLEYSGARGRPGEFDVHRYGYDFETLRLLLEDAGFSRVARQAFMDGPEPELLLDEHSLAGRAARNGQHYSLFVEARP